MNHCVYVLNSLSDPLKFYVGYTNDVYSRLDMHNYGGVVYTKQYKPWKLHCFFTFDNKLVALNFEKYLKTSSGRAFAKKHFSEK